MEIKIQYHIWEADGRIIFQCEGPALIVSGQAFALAGKKIKNFPKHVNYFGYQHSVPATANIEGIPDILLQMGKMYYPAELREYVKIEKKDMNQEKRPFNA